MNENVAAPRPRMGLVIAAFAAIYIIWGSTYLAIRIGVETLPPFLMAGFRFLVAGALMLAYVYRTGSERPTRVHWRSTAIVGGFLLLGGNGLVTWAEKTVPSGVAALLVTTVPIWMVLLHWVRKDGARPTLTEAAGVLIGFAGVALLVGSDDMGQGAKLDRLGAGALVLASLLWSFGSLYSRSAPLPKSPLLATAMEMLCGGALLTLFGLLRGEISDIGAASSRSILALIYLILFGSLIGFTAYSWLLRVTTPARVATYAFVNPVVAVALGCTLGNEPFTPKFIAASAVIIVAVILVIASRVWAKQAKASMPPSVVAAQSQTILTRDPVGAPATAEPPAGSAAVVNSTTDGCVGTAKGTRGELAECC